MEVVNKKTPIILFLKIMGKTNYGGTKVKFIII